MMKNTTFNTDCIAAIQTKMRLECNGAISAKVTYPLNGTFLRFGNGCWERSSAPLNLGLKSLILGACSRKYHPIRMHVHYDASITRRLSQDMSTLVRRTLLPAVVDEFQHTLRVRRSHGPIRLSR